MPTRRPSRARAKAQGKHKKQTGGRGQFGDTWIEIDAAAARQRLRVRRRRSSAASIPRQFIPAVEKGVREALPQGILAGYPIVDVKVTLYDGSYHDVDSSEMAFKIAASIGFKTAFDKCKPILLEPIMTLDGDGARRVHGRRHRRPEQPARQGARRRAEGPGQQVIRAARADVRGAALRARPALDDAAAAATSS